jgi:hypothetical protein
MPALMESALTSSQLSTSSAGWFMGICDSWVGWLVGWFVEVVFMGGDAGMEWKDGYAGVDQTGANQPASVSVHTNTANKQPEAGESDQERMAHAFVPLT